MSHHTLSTTRRFSISRKVAFLFSLLILTGVGNWLVLSRTHQQLEGAEKDINATGSLRYLSQQIQVSALSAAIHQKRDAGIEELIEAFERNLNHLEARGVAAGSQSGQAISRLLPALADVRSVWAAYRSDIRHFLELPPSRKDAAAVLPRLTQMAGDVLGHADHATSVLTEHVTEIKRETSATLTRAALADLAIMLAAFFVTRRQIVHPLRRLADASLRFAGGDYSTRTGFRAHDEIGQVSEAFDHMAEQTQKHIEVIAADLQEIRQKQADLNKLSKAVENSPASVMITDAEGTIQYVNPTFVDMTGYSFDEAVGQKPSLLKSGATPPETYRELWRTIRSGAVWRGEIMNRRKNGELFWEKTLISSVRNELGEITHFVAVKADVTARKRAEKELREINSSLEQRVADRTRRLEEAYKEQASFSYAVSHDLRGPLRAIHGFAHAMEEDCAGCTKSTSLQHLKRVQKASIRMSHIIDDLLALGEIGKTTLQAGPVNLSEIAGSVLEWLAAQHPERKVDIEVADDIVANGDPRLLRIVLENLLGNAWKFTANRNEARIAFGCVEEGGTRTLFVRDNGAGFNMNYASQLFKPFQRLHTSVEFEGTGIGLATVHRIIARHGGRIWANSSPDEGTTFSFTLPDPAEEGADFLTPE